MGILLIPLIDEHLPTDDGDTGSDGSRDDESDNDESLTPPHIEQDNNEDDRPRPDRYTGILCTYFAGEGIIILSGNLMLY